MGRMMKDSGIEWIGEIPETWERTSLLNVLRTKISDGPHETPNLIDNGIPFISVDSLNSTKQVNLDVCKKFISYDDFIRYSKKTIIEKGDILFSKAATIGKTAIVGDETFMVWSPLAVIKADENRANNCYLYHLLNCADLIKYISLLGSDNTQINVGMRELEKAIIPVPPLPEQKRIADFLDLKCAEIDSVIGNTEATIEEYKKLKQSIITEAVTKGIRGDRPTKDSGIEWVGEMPEEWESISPKALFSLRKDKAVNGERQLTSSQQYGIVYQDEYMELTGSKIVTVEKDFDILKHVETGDFVISMRSFQGGIEYSTKSGSISSAYVMLVPNLDKVFPRYYRWLLKSDVYINALQSTSNMVRDGQAMRYSNFAQVRLYTVPLDEQKEIADYLDEKCKQIDVLIQQKKKLVEEIKQYKQSVIYEYVTGKKEVQ